MLKSKLKKIFYMVALTIAVFNLSVCGCGKEEEPTTIIQTAAGVEEEPTTIIQTVAGVEEQAEVQSEDAVPIEQATESEDESQEQTVDGRVEGEGGGNEYNNDSDVIVYEYNILIDENEYYYENARISLDEFIETLQNEEQEKLVIISDMGASQNAYKELTDKLNELGVLYEDKQN